jgi:indole-3-glycerol phosphate synthase
MSMTTSDVLAAIVGATRRRVETQRTSVPLDRFEAAVAAQPRYSRRFRETLRSRAPFAVIAECKRRSPSRGVLRRDYDPATIARAYESAGAAGISVLTEPTFFDGALDHLTAVRDAVTIPVLRKDFTVDSYQLWEARAAGADAVLLIVAVLSDADLRELLDIARGLGLDALVEVHSEDELARALDAGADLVGVNNRNLRTLSVDTGTCRRLASEIPAHVVAVAESGLRSAGDLVELAEAGYRAFLVGERFMTRPDPGAALQELLHEASNGAPRSTQRDRLDTAVENSR